MNLARSLFKMASILTTAKIVTSGNPKRIGKHLMRRQIYKRSSRWLRKF